MTPPDGVKITDDDRRQVSGRELIDEIDIDSDDIDWCKEISQCGDADRRRLDEMSSTFDRIADDLIEEFYEQFQSRAETVASLLDRAVEQADRARHEMEVVAEVNEAQTEKVDEISRSVRRLTDAADGI